MKKVVLAALGLAGLTVSGYHSLNAQTLHEPTRASPLPPGAVRTWSSPAVFKKCEGEENMDTKKCADWEGDPEFHADVCRLRNPKVTVFKTGRVEWFAQAKATFSARQYATSLHFQDANVWVWIMPPFKSPSLGGSFSNFPNNDLAIAQHLYANLHSVSRWDTCPTT